MSKLFDDSSLAMIPSAVKDGKLYSIRPTDGSGDFTFSRGSNLAATRVDVNGLIEKGRENLILQSNQFDTGWSKTNVSVTSGQSGYDGSSDAWLLSKSAAFGNIQNNIVINSVQTYSLYAKANSSNWLILEIRSGGYVYYDILNGAVGNVSNTSIIISASVEDVGNGWYRCSIVANANSIGVRIYPAENNNDASGTSGSIYIQDAQLEQSLVATDYIETGASTAQAGILEDLPRLDYSGGASCPSLLLEPQRANLVVNSEYANSTNWSNGGTTYSNNQTTSPEGVNNAIKLIEDNSTTFHYLGSDISGVATAGTYSISGFIKKGTRRYGGLRAVTNGYVNRYFLLVDLDDGSVADTYTQGSGVTWSYDIKDYGNGWYRIEISGGHTSGTIGGTFSPSDTASPTYFGALPDYNGSTGEHIFCYGLQAELGSYPTSYIPTYGSAVTRSSEVCSQSFADITTYNQATFFSEFTLDPSNLKDSMIFTIGQSTSAGLLYLLVNDAGTISYEYYLNSTLINNGNTSVSFNDGKNKVAFKMSSEGIKLYLNGVLIRSTTPNMPSGNYFNNSNIYIGRYYSAAFHFVDPYNQFVLFPTALTDSECIALTTI